MPAALLGRCLTYHLGIFGWVLGASHFCPFPDTRHGAKMQGRFCSCQAPKSGMWEGIPMAPVVLINQSTCQSLALLSSPCWVPIAFLSLAKHRITQKIFILDGPHGHEPSTPWDRWREGCSPRTFKPQPMEVLWMRLTTCCRFCMSR